MEETAVRTGVIEGLPAEDYHADDAMGSSKLVGLKDTPLKFWAKHLDPLRVPEKPSDSMELGTAIHCALLEPKEFQSRFIEIPKDAPKRPTTKQLEAAKPAEKTIAQIAWWTAFDAKSEGKTQIKAIDLARVRAVVDRLQQKASYELIFADGKAEVSLFWVDPTTGVRCKCRLDWLSELPAWVDVKTTVDASPSGLSEFDEETAEWVVRTGFAKQADKFDYPVKVAHYAEGVKQVLGIDMPALLLALDNKWPHDGVFYEPDSEMLAYGKRERDRLLALYAKCMEKQTWPGYPDQILKLGLVPWKRGKSLPAALPETY
jgi:hypothetical protein